MERYNTCGSNVKEPKESEVSRELGYLHKSNEKLNKSIGDLRVRLSSVLRLQPPCSVETNKEPELITELAQQIISARRQIEDYSNAINEIIGLCEL